MAEFVVARKSFAGRRRCRYVYHCLVWTENCFTVGVRIIQKLAIVVGLAKAIWFIAVESGSVPRFLEYVLK
jgi:hypothetical protein